MLDIFTLCMAGTRHALLSRMKQTLLSRTRRKTLTLVRWEMARGSERVVCRIDRDTTRGMFSVIVEPYHSLQRASIERFNAAAAALRRYAMVAAGLRDQGWSVAAYTK